MQGPPSRQVPRVFPKNREILIDYAYARIFLLQLRYGAGGTLAEAAAVVEERNQGDLAGEIAADIVKAIGPG